MDLNVQSVSTYFKGLQFPFKNFSIKDMVFFRQGPYTNRISIRVLKKDKKTRTPLRMKERGTYTRPELPSRHPLSSVVLHCHCHTVKTSIQYFSTPKIVLKRERERSVSSSLIERQFWKFFGYSVPELTRTFFQVVGTHSESIDVGVSSRIGVGVSLRFGISRSIGQRSKDWVSLTPYHSYTTKIDGSKPFLTRRRYLSIMCYDPPLNKSLNRYRCGVRSSLSPFRCLSLTFILVLTMSIDLTSIYTYIVRLEEFVLFRVPSVVGTRKNFF